MTPDIMNLSDKEIIEELGRISWYTESVSSTRAEVDMAVLHEGVRRILIHLIKQ